MVGVVKDPAYRKSIAVALETNSESIAIDALDPHSIASQVTGGEVGYPEIEQS